ncbi:MAG: hypothetical protein RR033_06850 [Clostridia bacterium]
MKKKNKSKVDAIIDELTKSNKFDVLGMYTANPLYPLETPTQDADDL